MKTEKRFREDTGQIIDQVENRILTITQAKNKMNKMNERYMKLFLEYTNQRNFINEKGLFKEYLEWKNEDNQK